MEIASTPVFGEIRRNVAGIDLAWRAETYICGPRREDGVYEIEAFGMTTPELHRILMWLKDRKVESVAMESTSVYWIPLTDLLEGNGIEVVLVDARMVRMVPGRKSDVQDCQWLQKLHSCGLLRGAFRPPEAVAAARSVLREKGNLAAMRTQAIQQMQKSLDQMNIRVHHAVSDIDGKTGTKIIEAIVNGERNPENLAKLRDKRCKKTEKEIAEHLTGTWRAEHLFNLGQAFKTMRFLDERLAEYDLKAAEMFAALAAASDNPKPPEPPKGKKLTKKERKNPEGKSVLCQFMNFDLTSIDGIDYDAATIIVSELGTKIGSFPDEHHFVSYIGLAPSLSKSAGKKVRQKKRGKNTSRVGSVLRMAAVSQKNSQTELGAYYRSVARRIDGKTAVKATARRIAQLVYRGLCYGKAYIDRGAQTYELRLRDRTLNTVKKLIKFHNINASELLSTFVAA